MRFNTVVILSLATLLSALGCNLAPKEAGTEMRRAEAAGKPFEQPFEQRQVPDLPDEPTWQDVLRRAFLSNGDLEAAYFEWAVTLHRVPQEATWPNTNLAPSFTYMFSGERMKAFDRTTVNVGFDPMRNLELPMKTAQRAKVALAAAQAAGEKFQALKFDIQRRVLVAYLDLAMTDEKLRIARENVELLRAVSEAATGRLQAGGSQQDMLRAQTQWRLAENAVGDLESQRKSSAAMLNAMLARPATAELKIAKIPEPRTIAADDAALIALAVDQNPDLARLAAEVRGREDALELARMGFIPDLNPSLMFTGTVTQGVGAMIVLPTTIPQIRGMIDESRAMLRSTQAAVRQARADRAASFVAALYALRNAERQTALFEQTILPRADQAMESGRQSYATGGGTFTDLIETQRTLLEVRELIVEARVEREKRLAELEALAGVDIETLGRQPTTQNMTRPTTQP